MKQNNDGSTLIEIVVATAVMGLLVGAVCTSLMFGLRLNEKTDAQLKAQLNVSSAVETMMAEGIDPQKDYIFPDVRVSVEEQKKDPDTVLPYYKVTAESTTEDVSVTTYIRKAVTDA